MSHEITVTNGKAEMFSGSNQVPWHKLGTVVAGLLTARQALDAANLSWTVSSMPVSVCGQELPFPSEEDGSEDCWQGIVRDDNKFCLGIRKGRYTPIQNVEAFEFFDRVIGEGQAVYDTAGSLQGGKIVWILAKVNGTIKINGDEHREYALLVKKHGGGAMKLMFVKVRVVCANTLAIALDGAENVVSVRHMKNWRDQENEARRVLGIGHEYFATVKEALEKLGSQLLTAQQMKDFSTLLLPAEDENEVSTNLVNIRNEVNDLFGRNGNKAASRYDALNAVTDYVDHYRTVRGEGNTRMDSAIFGSGSRLKQRAFDVLTNEDIMRPLLDGTYKPTAHTLDADFNRLISR